MRFSIIALVTPLTLAATSVPLFPLSQNQYNRLVSLARVYNTVDSIAEIVSRVRICDASAQ